MFFCIHSLHNIDAMSTKTIIMDVQFCGFFSSNKSMAKAENQPKLAQTIRKIKTFNA